MNGAQTIEDERVGRLQGARNSAKKLAGSINKVKSVLSFGKKVSKHWLILATAILFDIFGLIPFIGIIFNFIFAGILLLYFGSKKLDKILLGAGIATIFDFFVGVLPVNIGAVLFRIALD